MLASRALRLRPSPVSRLAQSQRGQLAPRRTYAAVNTPGVSTTPVAPGAPISKPKKRYGRRFLLGTLLLTTIFYSGSALASQQSDGYRDFFGSQVPLGQTLLDFIEDRQVDRGLIKRLSEQARKTGGKDAELVQRRAERMAEFAKRQAEKQGKDVKDAVVQGAQKLEKSVEASTAGIKQKTEAATEAVKEKAASAAQKVERAVGAGKAAVSDAAEKVEDKVETAASDAAAALPAKPVAPRETVPVDYQRPRQLDATPQPPKLPEGQPYTETLPLGFEPPPGYVRPRPASAAAKAKTAVKEVVAPPKPAPLPLVAPTVSDLSASEPVLGQLAATIDSLAGYLNDSPSAVGDKGAREVINVASLDLQNLGKRLDAIKAEERKALDAKLEEKTREYNVSLLQAERDLANRLEKQEDDWKTAYEQERKQLVAAYREKLEGELSVQKELIEQRLQEEVIAQGVEMQRKWLSDIKERVETERAGRLGKLEALQGGLEQLGKTTIENSSWLEANRDVNKLWTAIRAAWQASLDGKDNTNFVKEMQALRNVASRSPSLSSEQAQEGNAVDVVLSSIPEKIQQVGVDTLPTLSAWFTDRLVPKIKKASLLPTNGGFVSYLSSAALSSLLFEKVGFVQGDDVVSTLSRAQWYLNHKDLESAAREVNQLDGWPKILARDWLEAARRHLEVRQALQIAEAEAGLASLLIL